MSWQKLDLDDDWELKRSIAPLVQHVYRQLKRPLLGGGISLHHNQIRISYIDQQPHTTVINIAEGLDVSQVVQGW